MIPIKEAIETGAWLHFQFSEDWRFRVKVLSFEKINVSQIEESHKIENIHENSQWWLMRIELLSLIKKKVRSRNIIEDILLIDDDGFQFQEITDHHLCFWSDYAKKTGLDKFYGQDLLPKMKVIGAISFLLPDDEAAYSLAMKNGKLEEA